MARQVLHNLLQIMWSLTLYSLVTNIKYLQVIAMPIIMIIIIFSFVVQIIRYVGINIRGLWNIRINIIVIAVKFSLKNCAKYNFLFCLFKKNIINKLMVWFLKNLATWFIEYVPTYIRKASRSPFCLRIYLKKNYNGNLFTQMFIINTPYIFFNFQLILNKSYIVGGRYSLWRRGGALMP